jgi:threonine dehydrogenase-like Zn-dependent dehydrogenase
VPDDEAIILSDIFPTAWMGAELAEIKPGNTVAVFGCGPVGQLAMTSARVLGAGRIFAIDTIPSRLAMARAQGAEVIDFNLEDPVETLLSLTDGTGVDRAIDAVGVDANRAHRGPAAASAEQQRAELERQQRAIKPDPAPPGDSWHPGDAPAQALEWAVDGLAKAGTLSVIGGYSPGSRTFPIGAAMTRSLTIRTGNCDHRRHIPRLLRLVRSGEVEVGKLVTQDAALTSAIDAFRAFDRREEGWIKVKLEPAAAPPPSNGPPRREQRPTP